MRRKIKYILANIAITLFAAFLGSTAMAQVTVTVPFDCYVQVAGVGGTIGWGQPVGDGGIVLMTDAYAGNNFTYNPGGVGGPTPAAWTLLGDLSVTQSATPPSPAIQSGGAVVPLSIMSYNENLILPYEAWGGGTNNARNIGQVTLWYNMTGPCSFIPLAIAFKVYKVYTGSTSGTGDTYLSPIVFDNCIEASTPYVASQAPDYTANISDGIGTDHVYWAFNSGSTPVGVTTDYFSADGSAWTFTTPPTFTGLVQPFTLEVCDGRANPWDGDVIPYASHTSCVTKKVWVVPTMPTWIIPGVPTCVPTGVTTASFSWYPLAGLTYTWTSSNGVWALSTVTGGGTETLNITDMDDNPSTLTLTITGPCPPVTFTFTINRNFDPTVTSISGPGCIPAGLPSNYTIISGAAVLGNCVDWTYPSGWTLTSLDGDESMISLTPPGGTLPGIYTITATECFCPDVLTFTVYVAPAAPGPITGPACVDRVDAVPPPVTYTCGTVLGATSYTWTPPPGWTCVGGCTTSGPSCTFIPGGCSPGPDVITVVANGLGTCSSPASPPFTVNYLPITPTGATFGCYSYTVPPAPGTMTLDILPAICGFYGTWIVTWSPVSFFSGYTVDPTTGEITFTTTGMAGQPTICVTHSCACGTGPTFCLPPAKLGPWCFLSEYCNPDPTGVDVYNVTGAPLGTIFTWSEVGAPWLPFTSSSGTLIAGGSGTVYGDFCVTCANGTCVSGPECVPPCTHSYPKVGPHGPHGEGDTTGGEKTPTLQAYSDDIKVNPNPNPGTFRVALPKFNTSATGKLIAADGKDAGNYTFQEGENYVSNDGLAPGIYYLVLNVDGNVSTYKIEILKQ